MSAYAQFVAKCINEKRIDEKTISDLQTISDEANRLSEMASSVLSLTKINKTRLVSIMEILKLLCRLIKPMVEKKGKSLSVCMPDSFPFVKCYSNELTSLLWNLLDNAVLYGGVNIVISGEVYGDNINIFVKDDGFGICPELLKIAFERGVTDGCNEGAGLGLPICREIARRNGGDVIIKSNEGLGTTVILILTAWRGDGSKWIVT
jgi:signal transduction histidine kinase